MNCDHGRKIKATTKWLRYHAHLHLKDGEPEMDFQTNHQLNIPMGVCKKQWPRNGLEKQGSQLEMPLWPRNQCISCNQYLVWKTEQNNSSKGQRTEAYVNTWKECHTASRETNNNKQLLTKQETRKEHLVTFVLSLLGKWRVCSQTLPNASREYGSVVVAGCLRTNSNFFWPGPHSALSKWRLPMRDQASGWFWAQQTNNNNKNQH